MKNRSNAWIISALTLAGIGCGAGEGGGPPEDSVETAADSGTARPFVRMRIHDVSADVRIVSGYSNGNVVAVSLDSVLVLIDAQSAERVEELRAALDASGLSLPVAAVIDTHYHTDHVGGNAFWRDRGADVWAHASVPEEMSRDTVIPEMDWHRVPEPAAALPTQLVTDSVVLGTETAPVVVRHVPAAHTGGDLVAWLPTHDVLHMGDIVEIGADPFVDVWAGGSLDGMIAAVQWALSVAGPETVIVPGHGPAIGRERLGQYLESLEREAIRCQNGAPGFGCPGSG